jgi:hypothetical protein
MISKPALVIPERLRVGDLGSRELRVFGIQHGILLALDNERRPVRIHFRHAQKTRGRFLLRDLALSVPIFGDPVRVQITTPVVRNHSTPTSYARSFRVLP